MFGLILGTFCLLALIATLRRHHYARYRFAHAAWHGWHGPHGGRHLGGRFDEPHFQHVGHSHHRHGRHGFLRGLFEYLDATPGQEKVIAQAFTELYERMRDARGEFKTARKTLATAIGGDAIDGAALDQALAQNKALVERFSQEGTQALLRVHEALDGEQRKELAELIANGPFGFRGFGRF